MQAPTGSNSQGWAWVVRRGRRQEEGDRRLLRQELRPVREQPARAQFKDDDLRATQRDAVTIVGDLPARELPPRAVHGHPRHPGSASTTCRRRCRRRSGDRSCRRCGSFMLAARERGLGSAWTTLHLPNEKEVAELLGIPYDKCSQAGLFPIAYTIGTDFKPAEAPARRPSSSTGTPGEATPASLSRKVRQIWRSLRDRRTPGVALQRVDEARRDERGVVDDRELGEAHAAVVEGQPTEVSAGAEHAGVALGRRLEHRVASRSRGRRRSREQRRRHGA